MAASAYVGFVSQVLRLMPSPILGVLDAWSYRLAKRRAAKRRLASLPQPAPIEYKLKPWRD
jgi:hypothetical protein